MGRLKQMSGQPVIFEDGASRRGLPGNNLPIIITPKKACHQGLVVVTCPMAFARTGTTRRCSKAPESSFDALMSDPISGRLCRPPSPVLGIVGSDFNAVFDTRDVAAMSRSLVGGQFVSR